MGVKNKNRIIIIVLIAVVIAIGSVWYCNLSKQRFTSKLHSAILSASESESSTFSMVNVTDFTWDGLYIFGPYTSTDEIESILDFSWPPAQKYDFDISEGICLLVFVHKGKVAQYCEYPRRDGDFSSLSSTDKITPKAAVFSVTCVENDYLVVEKI